MLPLPVGEVGPVVSGVMWSSHPEGLTDLSQKYNVKVKVAAFSISKQALRQHEAEKADLVVTASRRPTGRNDGTYIGFFTVTVLRGGLQPTKDPYPYAAPEHGYDSGYSFEVGPSDSWRKGFYIKARSGRVYAGSFITFGRHGLSFEFDGLVNPAGSRVLEPDPAKLITDPHEIQRLDEATHVK
jgi:hypothetical protein